MAWLGGMWYILAGSGGGGWCEMLVLQCFVENTEVCECGWVVLCELYELFE